MSDWICTREFICFFYSKIHIKILHSLNLLRFLHFHEEFFSWWALLLVSFFYSQGNCFVIRQRSSNQFFRLKHLFINYSIEMECAWCRCLLGVDSCTSLQWVNCLVIVDVRRHMISVCISLTIMISLCVTPAFLSLSLFPSLDFSCFSLVFFPFHVSCWNSFINCINEWPQ